LQGFGLNDTVGAGGFPSAKRKNRIPLPDYNTSRLFLRQTFGFGGEQENWPADQASSPARVDVSRRRFRPAKFAVMDVFDGNSYARTPQGLHELSMWAPGAFDYSADKVGLTYGATAELNQKHGRCARAIS